MASLFDLFNPSFFIFLGIIILIASFLVVYFESKMREQNHKISSMVSLVSAMAEELNVVRSTLNFSLGGGVNVNVNENNNVSKDVSKNYTMNKLITVSDDDEEDDKEESDEEESDEEDDEANSDVGDEEDEEDEEENSHVEDEDVESNYPKLNLQDSQIKILNVNIENLDRDNIIGDLVEIVESFRDNDVNHNNELNDNELNDNEINDIDEKNENYISKLDLKSINIDNITISETTETNELVDYKKMNINKLKNVVVAKGLLSDASKLKKNEILKLLGAE